MSPRSSTNDSSKTGPSEKNKTDQPSSVPKEDHPRKSGNDIKNTEIHSSGSSIRSLNSPRIPDEGNTSPSFFKSETSDYKKKKKKSISSKENDTQEIDSKEVKESSNTTEGVKENDGNEKDSAAITEIPNTTKGAKENDGKEKDSVAITEIPIRKSGGSKEKKKKEIELEGINTLPPPTNQKNMIQDNEAPKFAPTGTEECLSPTMVKAEPKEPGLAPDMKVQTDVISPTTLSTPKKKKKGVTIALDVVDEFSPIITSPKTIVKPGPGDGSPVAGPSKVTKPIDDDQSVFSPIGSAINPRASALTDSVPIHKKVTCGGTEALFNFNIDNIKSNRSRAPQRTSFDSVEMNKLFVGKNSVQRRKEHHNELPAILSMADKESSEENIEPPRIRFADFDADTRTFSGEFMNLGQSIGLATAVDGLREAAKRKSVREEERAQYPVAFLKAMPTPVDTAEIRTISRGAQNITVPIPRLLLAKTGSSVPAKYRSGAIGLDPEMSSGLVAPQLSDYENEVLMEEGTNLWVKDEKEVYHDWKKWQKASRWECVGLICMQLVGAISIIIPLIADVYVLGEENQDTTLQYFTGNAFQQMLRSSEERRYSLETDVIEEYIKSSKSKWKRGTTETGVAPRWFTNYRGGRKRTWKGKYNAAKDIFHCSYNQLFNVVSEREDKKCASLDIELLNDPSASEVVQNLKLKTKIGKIIEYIKKDGDDEWSRFHSRFKDSIFNLNQDVVYFDQLNFANRETNNPEYRLHTLFGPKEQQALGILNAELKSVDHFIKELWVADSREDDHRDFMIKLIAVIILVSVTVAAAYQAKTAMNSARMNYLKEMVLEIKRIENQRQWYRRLVQLKAEDASRTNVSMSRFTSRNILAPSGIGSMNLNRKQTQASVNFAPSLTASMEFKHFKSGDAGIAFSHTDTEKKHVEKCTYLETGMWCCKRRILRADVRKQVGGKKLRLRITDLFWALFTVHKSKDHDEIRIREIACSYYAGTIIFFTQIIVIICVVAPTIFVMILDSRIKMVKEWVYIQGQLQDSLLLSISADEATRITLLLGQLEDKFVDERNSAVNRNRRLYDQNENQRFTNWEQQIDPSRLYEKDHLHSASGVQYPSESTLGKDQNKDDDGSHLKRRSPHGVENPQLLDNRISINRKLSPSISSSSSHPRDNTQRRFLQSLTSMQKNQDNKDDKKFYEPFDDHRILYQDKRLNNTPRPIIQKLQKKTKF